MRFSTHFPLSCATVLALSLPCLAADEAGGQAQIGTTGVPQVEQTAVGPRVSPTSRRTPLLLAQAQPSPDSAAVERAREQLRQKMSELEAQQGGSTPTNPPAGTVTPPATAQSAVAAAAPAGGAPLSQAKEEELRQALEAAMQQTPPPADATRKAKAELKERTKAEARQKPVPPQTQPKPAAVQPAMLATGQQAATPTAAAAPQAAALPALPPAPSNALAFPPIEGPPLPVSAAQQLRLAELLARYMADKVTPEEYQRERAKILSEK